ncbi:hypothetical protein [Streptomyces sp. NRRL F-5135]|uniref:hypothetical protein n=1 Tax=Streptomyces sp. NRRL F-5135 TaxID=1463858 RepID=UPI0005691311|nr:hypothetical protein [Streptomyces sp. NRRL F-5135]
MSRIELGSEQVASIRRTLERRERDIIDRVLQQPDYPPLPACPECNAVVEQMDSMVEPPQFEVDERAILINVKPCGHRFRGALDIDQLS